jgi:hypothetical protein
VAPAYQESVEKPMEVETTRTTTSLRSHISRYASCNARCFFDAAIQLSFIISTSFADEDGSYNLSPLSTQQTGTFKRQY